MAPWLSTPSSIPSSSSTTTTTQIHKSPWGPRTQHRLDTQRHRAFLKLAFKLGFLGFLFHLATSAFQSTLFSF